MQILHISSPNYVPFLLTWRPSRLFLRAFALLIVLSACCIVCIPIPWCLRLLLLLVHTAHYYRFRAMSRVPSRTLHIPWQASLPVSVDGQAVEDLRVLSRGAITTLTWQTTAGKKDKVQFWPDTLLPHKRRTLFVITRMRLSS